MSFLAAGAIFALLCLAGVHIGDPTITPDYDPHWTATLERH